MRLLVDPPLTLRCKSCGGALLFKAFQTEKFTADSEIFVCEKCGREYRHFVQSARPLSMVAATKQDQTL